MSEQPEGTLFCSLMRTCLHLFSKLSCRDSELDDSTCDFFMSLTEPTLISVSVLLGMYPNDTAQSFLAAELSVMCLVDLSLDSTELELAFGKRSLADCWPSWEIGRVFNLNPVVLAVF